VPVPASDAIASDVGHGALGIRYGLRPMRDLLGETSGQRHVWAEARPKKLITGAWTGPTSSTYNHALAETFDGVLLDVVGVRTSSETLARVESQARCEATAGTFYWSGATLYAHLTAGADPAATTVVAELGVHVGTHGVVQPVLGPDRLANGTLEAWTDPGGGLWTPDGWTVNTSVSTGTITLNKTTSDPLQGTYAARVTLTAATGAMRIRQDFTTLAAGMVYRMSGAYRITGASGILAAIYIDDAGTNFVLPDGRTIGASTQAFTDTSNDGAWRRFAFDFICPAWGTLRASLFAQSPVDPLTGTVDFDDVALRPVHRFAFHEPILADGALPTIDAATPDAFYGPVSVGLGQLGLLNGGGRLEPLIAAYDWHNAAAVIRVGGRFTNGGGEIGIDDCPLVVSARLASPRVSDGLVLFDLQDDRQLLKQTLPRHFVNQDADVAQVDQGRPRALVFGRALNIRPPRVDLSANNLGIYEVADPSYASTRVISSNDVFCYIDVEAADKQDSMRRVDLKSVDFSYSTTTNRIEILQDVTPKVVTVENNRIDFNIGGAALVATITPRVYLPGYKSTGGAYSGSRYLCNEIATVMNAAAGTADILVTLSASTHKVTISKGAGTLQLLCSTGANRDLAMWDLLGFDNGADLTAALTYTGGTAIYQSADQHIVRVDAVTATYADDASGTYTGTAGATIQLGPDIAHFILRQVQGVSVLQIDVPSFVAGRGLGLGGTVIAVYLGASGEETLELGEIFAQIAASCHADILSEAGVWYWRPRSAGTVPTPVVDVSESDILDFVGLYEPEDNYEIVRVAYGQDVSTGIYRTQEVSSAAIGLRFGRPNQRTWKTYIPAGVTGDSAASARAGNIGAVIAWKKSLRFEVAVRGKALLLPVGAKLRITRSRGLGTTAPSALLCRILAKTDDWANWTSRLLVIEDNPS